MNGTNYWFASDTNVVVQTNNAAPGSSKAAMLPVDTTLSNRFVYSNPTNLWLRMATKPVFYDGTNPPVVDSNAAALFYVDSNGYFVVYDGNASNWIRITQTVYEGAVVLPLVSNAWVTNMDIFVDYTSKTWQIALGTTLLTNNIGFANPAASNLAGFYAYNGGGATTYLDNVYIYDHAPFEGFAVQPGALTNWGLKGALAPEQTFEIVGIGVRPLDYTIVTNDGAAWLTVDYGSGTISNDCTNVITVTYPTSDTLQSGISNSSFSVITSYGLGSTQTVAIELHIVDWLVTPTNIVCGVMRGYAPPATNFTMKTADTNQSPFEITTNEPVSWLSVTPGTGTLSAGTNSVTVNFATNGLDVGAHTAVLAVVATELVGGITDHVAAVVTVLSRPIPQVDWTNYSQTIHKGVQPSGTDLLISNTAAAPRSGMRYAVASTSAWLQAATNGVCTNGEQRAIGIQFADLTTNAGSYIETLTIHAVDTNTTRAYTPVGTISSTVSATVRVWIIGPGTPGNLTASGGTDTNGIQLSWTATTNVSHYEIWRGDTNIIAQAALLDTTTNLAYYDTTVNPGLRRWYWARAINDYGGDGNFSASALGWRFLPAPTDVTATSGAYTNRVALSWSGSSGAATYEIWRGVYTNVGLATRIGAVSAAVTTYDDTTGEAILLYYYWIRACTPDMGNYSDYASGYRAAMLKPSGVAASKGTFSSKIRVLWQDVSAATKYEVWRSFDPNLGNAVRIGTVTIRGYDDTAATPTPVFYYYWIRAHDVQGFPSPFSEMDSGWLRLAKPANVAATQGTRPYSVRISWSAVENAASYEVVRTSSPRLAALAQALAESNPMALGAPSLVPGASTVGESTGTFCDDNATYAGVSYLYQVRAKNALGDSDLSDEVIGWRQVRQAARTTPAANDYDGDKLADVVLYDTGAGLWRILCTTLGEFPLSFGDTACIPVPGDYDGDGLADPMIYSAADGNWSVMFSRMGYLPPIPFGFGDSGQAADTADYDGDGKTDPAAYQPAEGLFRILLSRYNYILGHMAVGGPGYTGVSADYDGDGLADPAAYSAADGILLVRLSKFGYLEVQVPFGGAGLVFVPGDFDGDGKSELTTYDETTGTLTILLSAADYLVPVELSLGGPGYAWIVPGDYDGDGMLDPAAYSQTDGWQIMFSSQRYSTVSDTFGGTNNVPFTQ